MSHVSQSARRDVNGEGDGDGGCGEVHGTDQHAALGSSGERPADTLSFLFAPATCSHTAAQASAVGEDARQSIGVITATEGIDALEEMQRLMGLKGALADLMVENDEYVDSLQGALRAIRRVADDLDRMDECLVQARKADRQDSVADVLPVHVEHVSLPLFPQIYKQVPLLASQSGEIERLRLAVCNFPWLEEESGRLKRAVLEQCLRLATLRLATSSDCPPDLLDAAAARWTEEELSALSLPAENDDSDGVDWMLVAQQVGGTHVADDCCTRWLMVDRPGLRQNKWTDEEKARLAKILDKHVAHSDDGIIRDWEAVSREHGTGRLAIDCLMTSQQNDMVPMYAATSAHAWEGTPLSDKESKVLDQLHRIWNHHHAIIAERLGSSRPEHLVPRAPKRQRTKRIEWSAAADDALVVHVSKQCRTKRKKALERDDLAGPTIDFGKPFPRRPEGASAEVVERRWKKIKAEHQRDPTKYIKAARTQSQSETSAGSRGKRKKTGPAPDGVAQEH